MKATRDGFGEQLVVSAKEDTNIIALSADLSGATRLSHFAKAHPDRFFELGIAENNMIGIASGMAENGYKVFLASFASFLTGKYDTIRCSLSYSKVPCVIVGTHSGMAIGRDGVTQMGLEDISLMRSLPNMVVLNPSTYNQTRAIVRYLCENKISNPYYLRLGRQPICEVYPDDLVYKPGDYTILKEGNDGVVFSTGCVLESVLEASRDLDVTVIDLPTIKPIDKSLIKKYSGKTIVTVEDHSIIGGLGSAVAEVIAENNMNSKLIRIALEDVFPESGKPEDLYEKYGLSSKKIKQRVLDALDK
ncbi:MAG: transketolase family protein [Candidatus Hodarchaeales archaeon]|jgi:transketolase